MHKTTWRTMAGGDATEKLLEEYKKEQEECRKDLKEEERAEYDARTAEEKTEWLRCAKPKAALFRAHGARGARCSGVDRRVSRGRASCVRRFTAAAREEVIAPLCPQVAGRLHRDGGGAQGQGRGASPQEVRRLRRPLDYDIRPGWRPAHAQVQVRARACR